MPADKFSVSLPHDLAAELEELARQDGVTRSFMIQEASARYVAQRKTQAQAQRRSASVDAAIAGFDEVAALWGEDERAGIDYMVDLRTGNDLPREPHVSTDE